MAPSVLIPDAVHGYYKDLGTPRMRECLYPAWTVTIIFRRAVHRLQRSFKQKGCVCLQLSMLGRLQQLQSSRWQRRSRSSRQHRQASQLYPHDPHCDTCHGCQSWLSKKPKACFASRPSHLSETVLLC